MKEFLEISECRDSLTTFLTEASLLADELMELQEVGSPPFIIGPSLSCSLQNILTANDVTNPPRRKRRKLDTEPSMEVFHQIFVDSTEDVMALEQK